jgi:predicted O-methyltransferase YrrM
MPGDERNYPESIAVKGPSEATLEHLRTTKARVIAEIGVYRGYTSQAIADWLDGRGELHLFDFEDTVSRVVANLHHAGHDNVRGYGNSYKYLDSYNWSLAAVLREHPKPIYDYVFLDGAHTWAVDALATLLVDRLLKPGGFLAFDDYGWTLEKSKALRPENFPLTGQMYTDEQIRTPQVEMICDLLVRRDPRYGEVVPNRVWRKRRRLLRRQ